MPTVTQLPDRRERRRRRTRDDIAAAALHLMAERGFERVTVDDIAAAADIAPRTFFRYFAAKEDVLFADHDERLEQLRAAFARRPADEPVLQSLRAAVLALVDGLTFDREQLALKARLAEQVPALRARSLQRQNEWREVLAEAVAPRLGGEPAAELRVQVVAATTVGAVQAAIRVWVADRSRRELRDVVAEALDLLGDGLGAPGGDPPGRPVPART